MTPDKYDRTLMMASSTALCLVGSLVARGFAFAPANTKFVLTGKVSFGPSVRLAQWVVRTGVRGSGRARVAIADQLLSRT